MPVKRTLSEKRHPCKVPKCTKSFHRFPDLERHVKTHCSPEEREYGCPFAITEGCTFRANQQGGLKSHLNSGCHYGKRLPCTEPGCNRTFSGPSCLCNHRQKAHGAPSTRKRTRSPERGSGSSTAAPHGMTTEPSQGASTPLKPLMWLTYTPTSASFEFRGKFHEPHDVQTDCSSVDTQINSEHQQADHANYPDAAQSAWDISPPLSQPEESRPGTQSPDAEMAKEASEAPLETGQRCRYASDRIGLKFRSRWERMEDESDVGAFSLSKIGHVHPFDTSEYLRSTQ